MKLLHSSLSEPLAIKEGDAIEFVIENQKLFRETVEDLKHQLEGENGSLVLSINDKPVTLRKHVELINDICPFDINSKALLNRIYSNMESTAISEQFYAKGQELLAQIEQYLDGLGEEQGVFLDYTKLSFDSIVRAIGTRISVDYETPLEAIVDYMELTNRYDGEKLYCFINFRSYFNDDEMLAFIQTLFMKGLRALFLESLERKHIKETKRVIIDADLCVI